MDDTEFYKLCYDQYKMELKDSETFYQRAGVLLIVLPLLGGVILASGPIDTERLYSCINNISIALYYLFTIFSLVCIAFSIIFLYQTILPRDYKNLALLSQWNEWRKKWGNENEKGEIIEQLVDVHDNNTAINEKRRNYFHKSVQWAGITLIGISAQTIFYIVISIKGID